jgi:hypothetical protein
MKKILLAFITFFSLLIPSTGFAASPPSSTVTVTGLNGQKLTVSQTKGLKKDAKVTVTGSGYDKDTGIYVTFCVIPKKGKKPDHCGAYNIAGINSQAVWISSNPPLYAALLTTGFKKGGKFKVELPLSKTIGDKDCTKVKCAVLTRADHTDGDNRTADLIVPITFSK